MPTDMLIILVLIVLAIIFTLGINSLDTNNYVDYNPYVVPTSDLDHFEDYYLDTLHVKYAQKAEKIANPTRAFTNDGNIFEGLSPWSSTADFGTTMHTLIGYGVRLKNPTDPLFHDLTLADNLYNAIVLLYYTLPYPAPVNSAPWGASTDWYHFSITMPECLQNTCIVLRGYRDLTGIVEHILYHYLPEPTMSLGWRRTAGNAMRMGLPYAYGQLLRGKSYNYIRNEPKMLYIIGLVSFNLVTIGNGIHVDYAYFDHTDVRAYGYLLNSFFTFSYYNFLFGDQVVHMDNANASIDLVGSETGYMHPALMSRQGSNYSNVIGAFIPYRHGVLSADFSKILTVRTPSYFGSVVGQTHGVAYYEADEVNNLHAPLWAMTRKIWANKGRVIRYRPGTLGFESGVIMTSNLNGVWSLPTTGPTTSSFHPTLAQTAICATMNAGVMVSRVRLEELNIAFDSYTLYHSTGMLQLYDNVLALTPITNNARCVVLTKDLTVDNEPWTAAANVVTSNSVTAHHVPIANNPGLSNFVLRTFDEVNMQVVEQLIGAESINAGLGTTCYRLTVEDEFDDNTKVTRVPNGFVVTVNSIELAVVFPVVVLKDNVTRQVTINDATSKTRHTHEISFSVLREPLALVSLDVDSLYSDTVKKTSDSFTFDNTQSNQFRFVFDNNNTGILITSY
uniref:Odv-e66 n=1 Tax=Spodoptera frugiperda granulovirus TaxID=307454 RepID=A0A346QW50_9BBAC|nr:odv-e66 [Spodoptera frugiperda granulovirus]